MKWIGFALLVALLCGETTYLIVQQASNGSWRPWQKLSPPPEKAEHIAWFNGGRVVVETLSHAYYSCDLQNAPNCWQSTSWEQFAPYSAGLSWQPTSDLAPPYLPGAAEIKYVEEQLGEITVVAAVAINYDGTVHAWSGGGSIYDTIVNLLLPLCAAAGGLFVTLIVRPWPKKRRVATRAPRPQPKTAAG